MTDADKKVLAVLARAYDDYTQSHWAYGFDYMTRETGLDRKAVRLSCRRLARKGLLSYERGLWTEEGRPAGAGYACTKQGSEAWGSVT